MKKGSNGWEGITWEETLETIAEKFCQHLFIVFVYLSIDLFKNTFYVYEIAGHIYILGFENTQKFEV